MPKTSPATPADDVSEPTPKQNSSLHLEVYRGQTELPNRPIDSDRFLIGSDQSCDLRLQDVEDNDVADVTVSRALINRYKHNLQTYCLSLKDYCTRRGISYLFTSTTVPFDQMVLNYLRNRGLLR